MQNCLQSGVIVVFRLISACLMKYVRVLCIYLDNSSLFFAFLSICYLSEIGVQFFERVLGYMSCLFYHLSSLQHAYINGMFACMDLNTSVHCYKVRPLIWLEITFFIAITALSIPQPYLH